MMKRIDWWATGGTAFIALIILYFTVILPVVIWRESRRIADPETQLTVNRNSQIYYRDDNGKDYRMIGVYEEDGGLLEIIDLTAEDSKAATIASSEPITQIYTQDNRYLVIQRDGKLIRIDFETSTVTREGYDTQDTSTEDFWNAVNLLKEKSE